MTTSLSFCTFLHNVSVFFQRFCCRMVTRVKMLTLLLALACLSSPTRAEIFTSIGNLLNNIILSQRELCVGVLTQRLKAQTVFLALPMSSIVWPNMFVLTLSQCLWMLCLPTGILSYLPKNMSHVMPFLQIHYKEHSNVVWDPIESLLKICSTVRLWEAFCVMITDFLPMIITSVLSHL